MVECGNAELRDRQVYKLETEGSTFRAIFPMCIWSLIWLKVWTQKMVSNCWYKNAGSSSGYPKILSIIQIGNIERQKENTSNYACVVRLNIPGMELIDIQAF